MAAAAHSIQEPMLPAEVELSEAQRKQCVRIFCVFCFFTAVSAQTFMTSLPLLIEDGLHHSVLMSGVVQTVMVVGSITSYIGLIPLLRRVTPRTLAIVSQAIRILSSAVFSIFVGVVRPGPSTLPIIIASRFVFGLSMGAAGIPAIWIGHRFEQEARPRAVATYSAALGCGMIIGPVVGSVLQTASSNILIASALPGWVSVGTSFLLILLMRFGFPDARMMPHVARREDLPKTDSRTKRTLVVVVLVMFLVLFAAQALEGTVPIIIEHAYGWGTNRQYLLFVPVGVGTLIAAIVMIEAQERVNWSWLALLMTCGYAGGLVLSVNLAQLSTPINSTSFVLGIVLSLVCCSTSFTLHSSVLSVKAPPHMMSAVFSLQAALGQEPLPRRPSPDQCRLAFRCAWLPPFLQVARSIGPLATSGLYQAVNDSLGMGYATNLTTLSVPALSLAASFIALFNWHSMYGKMCDPSFRSVKRVEAEAAAVLARFEAQDEHAPDGTLPIVYDSTTGYRSTLGDPERAQKRVTP
ncbi:hypothetical protein AB1Y20_010440 [Prymnesium parvum]|uniref:Major facilitator superfamily (MFS) profile domain-containing protein n=1 Tax=Prymnesium parvum TaxID=97485 RepID=A0AB34IPA2_PRYPA